MDQEGNISEIQVKANVKREIQAKAKAKKKIQAKAKVTLYNDTVGLQVLHFI